MGNAPYLSLNMQIVDPNTGYPTREYQRWWQNNKDTADTGASQASDVTQLKAQVVTINGQITTLQNGKVAKNTSTGWVAPTGTASKATFATYAASTISNPPTQAEVQAIANHLQVLSQHMKALIDAAMTANLITT